VEAVVFVSKNVEVEKSHRVEMMSEKEAADDFIVISVILH
jgi:hypothetical protein